MRASRAAVTVLTAQVIRPDYRSGETFRHVVLADGIVTRAAGYRDPLDLAGRAVHDPGALMEEERR